jgi:DNA-binding NtrC family response regulator
VNARIALIFYRVGATSAAAAWQDGAMKDDFFSLRMLIVSEAASERGLLRKAAEQISVPAEVAEIETAGDPTSMGKLLERGSHDVVFFDSRIPRQARMELLNAIRAAPSRPLAILVGAAAMRTREVLTEGLEVDSALAKPIELQEACDLIERCVRARLPKRILIVDDSSTVRSIVRKVLQASRFTLEADEAADGSAAIALAKKQRFDIVFLDYQMPGIDGFTALAGLKRVQPDTKVVMMTGTRDVRIEDRARAEGAKDFLYKPFFARDIDAVLNRLLGLALP